MTDPADTGPVKRSMTIAGHRTSISMEPEFWSELQTISRRTGKSIASIVSEVDAARGTRNLSSAVRVYILNHLKSQD